MRALVVVAALAVLVGTSAQAQSFNPDWVKKPNGEDFAAAWPIQSWGVEGKATIVCDVNLFGGLEGCEVASETPEGAGFGVAALLLAPGFQMKPRIEDGKPVRGRVRVPISFSQPDKKRSQGGGRAPASEGAIGPSFMMVAKPLWRTAPGYDDIAEVWPKGAKNAAGSRVTMRCRVLAGGGVTACEGASQEKDGHAFIAAARKLAPLFRLAIDPTVGSEKTVFVNVPVVFVDPAVTPTARTVSRPLWIRGIDPTRAAEVFPPAAAKGLTAGTGVADCLVAKDGGLTDCKVSREDPVGLGFGPAAVAIAGVMQMSPWTEDGRPVDGARIKLPIRLERPADAAAPAPSAR